MLLGAPGVLNGTDNAPSGQRMRDPNHGLAADYEFHPVLIAPRTDDEVRHAITGRRYWPTNLPAPGQRVAEVLWDEGRHRPGRDYRVRLRPS